MNPEDMRTVQTESQTIERRVEKRKEVGGKEWRK